MRRPPEDPRRYRRPAEPTWTGIAATSVLVLAVPVVLWAASNPLASAAALAAGVGLVAGGRRALRLGRCLAECGGFAVDLAGDVRLCVTRDGATTC